MRSGKTAVLHLRVLHPRRVSREGGYSFLAGPSLLPAEATSTRETLLFPCGGAGRRCR